VKRTGITDYRNQYMESLQGSHTPLDALQIISPRGAVNHDEETELQRTPVVHKGLQKVIEPVGSRYRPF